MIDGLDLQEYISKGKNPTYRKLANNTYAVITKDIEDRPICGIQFHKTVIYAELPDGNIQLQNGGWSTITTKKRINEILYGRNIKAGIFGGEWLYGRYDSTNNVEFQNGLIIDRLGNPTYDDLVYIYPNKLVSDLTNKDYSEWNKAKERQRQRNTFFHSIFS